jgi:hypothetical protein
VPTSRRSVPLAALVVAVLVAGALAAPGPAASGVVARATAPAAGTTYDDRALELSKGRARWQKVRARPAYAKTLSRASRAKATARTPQPAVDGGTVTVQVGPGRGTLRLTVGASRTTVRTKARKVGLRTVSFAGAGPVTLTVLKPGRGVYLDAVTLAPAPVVPPPTVPTTPPTASPCAAPLTDAGPLTSVRGTVVRLCQLPGRITADLTLARLPGVVYALGGPVEVGSDVGGDGTLAGGTPVTLTVAAGVSVVATTSTAALVVDRGSRLVAVGTASQPVVFTSLANLRGEATESSGGVWAGISVLGRAPISSCDSAVPGGSAGCQATLPDLAARYGGNASTDTSGTLSYLQVRYAGAGTSGAGLRLAGVGDRTVVDHVQVSSSGGDGLAVLGGRVNASSLALTGAADDLLFTDAGYRGRIQYLVAAQAPSVGAHVVLVDSNGAEDALPRQYVRIANATLVARTSGTASAVLVRGGADAAVVNTTVASPNRCLSMNETGTTTTRAADSGLQDYGPPVFRSVRMGCATAFGAEGNVSSSTLTTIFGSGSNGNSSNATLTLNGVVNGPNEAAATVTDPSVFNADIYGPTAPTDGGQPNRLLTTTYVGAISGVNDPRFAGWSCDSTFAALAGATACSTSPV